MRLRNDGGDTVTIAGLAIPPGRVGEVSDEAVAAWLRRSPTNARTLAKLHRLPPVESFPDKLARVCRTIRDEPSLYWDCMTRDGKPTCAVLRDIVGKPVSAAQRDAAWARATEGDD